jgi:hypothetical protein
MMNKYKISIDHLSYKKLQKKLSKYNIKIGEISIRNFLIANSVIEDSNNALPLRVKRIILHVAGDLEGKIEELENERQLDSGLLYRRNEYMLLRRHLDRLVKEYHKDLKVTAAETEACQTVLDCVDMVCLKVYPDSYGLSKPGIR